MANTNYTAKVNEELAKLKDLLNFIKEANEDTANAYKEQLDHAQNLLNIHKQDKTLHLMTEVKAQEALAKAEENRLKTLKELTKEFKAQSDIRVKEAKQIANQKRRVLSTKTRGNILENGQRFITKLELKKQDLEIQENKFDRKEKLEQLRHRNKLEEDYARILDRSNNLKSRLKAVESLSITKRQLRDYAIKGLWKAFEGENSPFEINKREAKRKEDINALYRKNLADGMSIEEASEIRGRLLDDANANITKANDRIVKFALVLKVSEITIKLFIEGMKKAYKLSEDAQNLLRESNRYVARTGINTSNKDTRIYEKASNRLKVEVDRFVSSLGSIFRPLIGGLKLVGAGILKHANNVIKGITNLRNGIYKFASWISGGLINAEIDTLEDSTEGINEKFITLSSGLSQASESLNNFRQAVSNGQNKISANNMTNTASEIAMGISSDNYLNGAGYTSDQILDMITASLSGSGAEELGIHTDSSTLAGWAAMTQGKDIVNVDITEEKKQQMILDMINAQYKEMAKNGKGSLQAMVKEWKTLGNIMEKTKNQTLSFDEVINLAAFDPEIPDYESEYNNIGTIEEAIYNANGRLITFGENGKIVYKDFNDWAKETGGTIDDVTFALDENGNMVMMTNEVYKDLESKVNDCVKVMGSGSGGLAGVIQAMPGTTEEAFAQVIGQIGLTKSQAKELAKELEKDYNIKIDISDALKKLETLSNQMKILNQKSIFESGEFFGYSREVQEYASNGWQFENGKTLNDINGWNRFWGGLFKNSNSGQMLKTESEFDALGTLDYAKYMSGHASGGISTKAHLAHISEMNKAEAIIPLESSIGINALSEAMNKAGAEGLSQGNTYNIHLHLDGINIADNDTQWSEVANRIAEYMQINVNRQGEYNYGLV